MIVLHILTCLNIWSKTLVEAKTDTWEEVNGSWAIPKSVVFSVGQLIDVNILVNSTTILEILEDK